MAKLSRQIDLSPVVYIQLTQTIDDVRHFPRVLGVSVNTPKHCRGHTCTQDSSLENSLK